MIGSKDFRVFLSAVSSEFGEARSGVASDLRARGIEVKVQEDFRQEAGSDTTLAKLHDYIRDCSAVVCVIGERSGSVPPEAAVEPFAEQLPEGLERASYTQWELLFARRYDRRLSIYHAGAGYEPDRPEPTGEDDPELQAAFVRWLFEEQGLDRGTFSNPDALGRLVLREDWPKQRTRIPVVLPYPSLGDLFRGRKGFLKRLRESLQSGGDDQATAIAGRVLHGLGGVGKTRLAVEYAWQHLEEYSAVLFVPAETPALLWQNLAALCGAEALDLSEKEAPEEAAQVAAALGWLAEHPGWLLILDNLDTREAAQAVEDLRPRLRGGHVLLTGRLAEWGGDIRALELDVLEEDEAARFLLDRTEERRRRQPTDEADAHELARELDGLALALEQAGAYIAQRRRSLGQYLDDWRSGARGVRSWYDPRAMKYPRSVAATWQTTVDRLSAGELALLRLLAWFAPEPVPQFVFEADGAEEIWQEAIGLPGQEEDREAGGGDLMTALAGLAGYSMLRWDAQSQAVTVHRVVQEILRETFEEPVRREWLILSLRLLASARPGDPDDVRTWSEWDGLRSHVAFGVRLGEEVGAPEPTTVLMNNLGLLLRAKALNAEAEPLMCRALEIDEASYGPDHPKVAIGLSNLAQLLQATNRLAEAEPLMRRALEIDEASYGPDHPDVAIRLNNLAQLLKATNRLAEAEPLMRRALEIDEASYGPDHPDVAIHLNNLAQLLKATNRLAEAEPLMRRALEIDEASYGPDHPRVAVQLNNLAQLLQATNRLAEAEPLMRRALEIDEASYGPDHPRVAVQLNNLAQLLQATKRLAEAEPLMRRALEIDEASYGPDHPKVAIGLSNLAQLLQATNRLAEAEPLMRRALEIDEASYGPDHPDVAIRLNNLAQLLQATNRLAEAEPLMRRALEIDEASYGPDHSDVAIFLNNLAQLLKATNRLAEAEPLMRRMVVIFLRFLKGTGHEHPHLQPALANFTGLLGEMGRTEEEIRAEVERLRAEVVADAPSGGGEGTDS